MRNYFITIEVYLDGDTAYFTRLANEKALNELKKTKVQVSAGGYGSNCEPFDMVAYVIEVTDDEIETLKNCGVDHISVGNIMLIDEDGKGSELPYDAYDDADALLNYALD